MEETLQPGLSETHSTDELLRVAREYRNNGENIAAQEHFRQAATSAIQQEDRQQAADILRELGIFEFEFDRTSGFRTLSQSLTICQSIGYTGILGDIYMYLGNHYRLEAEADLAIDNYRKAIDSYRATGDSINLQKALGNFSGFLFENNYTKEAEQYMQEAILVSHQTKNFEMLTRHLINYAKIQYNNAKTLDAINTVNLAIQMATECDNNLLIALSAECKGFILRHQGNYLASINYYREALARIQSANEKRMEATIETSLALSLFWVGEIAESEQHFLRANELYRKQGNATFIGFSLSCLADLYFKMNDLERAHRYFQDALEIHRHHGNRNQEALVLRDIAKIPWQQGDTDRAIALLKESLEIVEEEHLLPDFLRSGSRLIKYLLELGKTSDAEIYISKIDQFLPDLRTHSDFIDFYATACRFELVKAFGSSRVEFLSNRVIDWSKLPRIFERYNKMLEIITQFQLTSTHNQVSYFLDLRTDLLQLRIPESDIPIPEYLQRQIENHVE